MSSGKPIIFETTFEKYTSIRIIGEGGAGTIYQVKDEAGDIFAVKLLKSSEISRERLKRFKNELTFCSRNTHENIVPIIDSGVFHRNGISLPFYVMPYMEGNLRSLINKGIENGKVLGYFSQLLNGVEAAHLQKVVHRDLKPENILHDVSKDKLLVSDFGIAQYNEEELFTTVETAPHTRLANFQYAAPEQRQRGGKVDYRADIYALGLMLNEMYTGAVPSGTDYRTITKMSPDHGYLDDIVANMLRQNPDDRIQTIEIVKQQLISRKNEFISFQKISILKQTIIPTSEIDDPLINDPPRLINFDWNNGNLFLYLSRPVNELWIWAFHNMGSHSAIMGSGPERFGFDSDKAIISCRIEDIQRVIDFFKGWLPQVQRVYEQRVHRDKADAEEKQRKALQKKLEDEERRQNILKSIKI